MTKIDEFINRSELLHNNKYDYSLTEYIKSSEKVSIICKEHENTLKKEKILSDAGYIVKSIWEKDFKLINKIKYRYNV